MQVFRALTRKPSIQPSAVDPASASHLRPTPPQATLATQVTRTSHISSIAPAPGMLGILITDGVQMTIEYIQEVPYSGPLPTRSPVIVQPVPKFRVGNQLALFIDSRHFIAKIIAVAVHVHEGPGDAPRIGTHIFDFPTTVTGAPSFEATLPTPNISPKPTAEMMSTESHVAAPSGDQNAPTIQRRPTQRTRAVTLSTAALNISQSDQEAFQRVQQRFLSTGPSPGASAPRMSVLPEQLPPTPSSPTYNRASTDSAIPNRPSLTQSNAATASPRPSAGGMQRSVGRTRTASAAAAPTALEESRAQQVPSSRHLRPSGSAVPVAVRSTMTPAPRRRLRSDAGARGNPTKADLILPQRLANIGLSASPEMTAPRTESAREIIKTVENAPPKLGLFNFGSGKLWPSSVHFPKRKTAVPSPEKESIDSALSWLDETPHVPLPPGLSHASQPLNGSQDENRVSWISLDWATAKPKTSPVERQEDVDPLSPSTQNDPLPSQRRPSKQDVTRKPGSYRKKPRELSTASGIVRVNLDPSPNASPTPTIKTYLSNSESRRFSARKDLPPLPSSSALLGSPDSLAGSQIQEETENPPNGTSTRLGDILNLTPPQSRAGSLSAQITPKGNPQGHTYIPRTPDSGPQSKPKPKSTASARRSADTPQHVFIGSLASSPSPSPALSAPRVTTCEVKPMVWARGQVCATPTPLEQMRTRAPGGSVESLTTQAYAEADDEDSSSLGRRYKTAPSSVGAPSTDSGSWDRTVGSIDITNLPRAMKMSGAARAWYVDAEELCEPTRSARVPVPNRPPVAKF